MVRFEQKYEEWLQANILQEKNHRRVELLEKGLGHGTVEYLRLVWFPSVGNFDHLYPEWEVRDFNNGYRYIDLAYLPSGAKGGIEIQGYSSHARDLDVKRFKDLCRRIVCYRSMAGRSCLLHTYPLLMNPCNADRWPFLSLGNSSLPMYPHNYLGLKRRLYALHEDYFVLSLHWSYPSILGSVIGMLDVSYIN